MHGNERVPITKREKSLGGYNTRSFYFKEGVWDAAGVRIHSRAGSSGSNHGNIDTGRSVAPKPPVVVRAAFQFVSTHPFFIFFFICRFHRYLQATNVHSIMESFDRMTCNNSYSGKLLCG